MCEITLDVTLACYMLICFVNRYEQQEKKLRPEEETLPEVLPRLSLMLISFISFISRFGTNFTERR